MALAFDQYGRVQGAPNYGQPKTAAELQDEYNRASSLYSQSLRQSGAPTTYMANQNAAVAQQQRNKNALWDQLQAARGSESAADPNNPQNQANAAWGEATRLTSGFSDRILNDPQMAAAMQQLESMQKAGGPYTPEVQRQITNRFADQQAAAEAANAQEVRDMSAARGMDPRQAIAQGQAQRQQANIAFGGDMATKAALANYESTRGGASQLANMRLAQYSAAQPGYMAAAQANLQRQFGGQRAPSVTNSVPNLAFSGGGSQMQSSGSIIPQIVPQTPQQPFVNRTYGGSSGAAPLQNQRRTAQAGATSNAQTGYAQPIVSTQPQRNTLLNSLNNASTYPYRPTNLDYTGGGRPAAGY
jgi:hypothetical protein